MELFSFSENDIINNLFLFYGARLPQVNMAAIFRWNNRITKREFYFSHLWSGHGSGVCDMLFGSW